MIAIDTYDPATIAGFLGWKLDPLRTANDALNAAVERHGGKVSADDVRDEMQAVRRVVADTVLDLWVGARLCVGLDENADDGFMVNLYSEDPTICETGIGAGAQAGALIDAIERSIQRLSDPA